MIIHLILKTSIVLVFSITTGTLMSILAGAAAGFYDRELLNEHWNVWWLGWITVMAVTALVKKIYLRNGSG
jgi:hypothetical protein